MSPGENTRPILKKKKMIPSIELIEENTYARTSFDNGNRALKSKRKPPWQIVLQSRILDNFRTIMLPDGGSALGFLIRYHHHHHNPLYSLQQFTVTHVVRR